MCRTSPDDLDGISDCIVTREQIEQKLGGRRSSTGGAL